MIVKKIYNNNLIGSVTDDQKEVILYGKGIGFHRKRNEEIPLSDVEKIYYTQEHSNEKLKTLIDTIPKKYVDIADFVIQELEKNLNIKLNNSILITLSDHLYALSERYQAKVFFPNTMLWEIKRLYPIEFNQCYKITKKIGELLNIPLNEDEAGFITFHIISAKLDQDIPQVIDMTEFINGVVNICKYSLRMNINENSKNFRRFVIHLEFLSQSIFSSGNKKIENASEFNNVICETYKLSFSCVQIIDKYIFDRYKYKMTDNEKTYLTIHIQRLVEDNCM